MKQARIRVAGILKKDESILFVKHKKNGREYYLLPGGGIDYGETFYEALKREFLEEVNLKINPLNMFCISEAISPDKDRHIVNLFFEVEYISGELKIAEEDRIVGAKYIPISDLNKYTIFPNIKKELLNFYNQNKKKEIKYIGNIWEA